MSSRDSEELTDAYADNYRDPFDTAGFTDEDSDLPALPLGTHAYEVTPMEYENIKETNKPSGSARSSPLPSSSFLSSLFSGERRGEASAVAKTTADRNSYLSFERRSLTNQMSYNVGYSYFGGLLVGGAYGLLFGLRSSPSPRPRILLNSILNGSGKYGAKTGNAAGVIAMIYTVLERQFEDAEIDKLPARINDTIGMDVLRPRYDWTIPAVTAFTTGALFTLPRAVTMKGLDKHYITAGKRLAVVLSGGLATVAGVAVLAVAGPYVFGKRSPYRFAS